MEKYFLDHSPEKQVVEVGKQKKGQVLVLTSFYEVPDNLKPHGGPHQDGPLTVGIFVPGLFQADKPNTGNHPDEAKLMGSMEVDLVIMAKGEGLNSDAYLNDDGTGACQKKVSAAVWQVLQKQINEYVEKHPQIKEKGVELKFWGYSEGSSQAPSLATRAVEDKTFTVKNVTSIGAGGLVGSIDQSKVNLGDFWRMAKQRQGALNKSVISQVEQEDAVTLFVSHKLMGNREAQELEQIKERRAGKKTVHEGLEQALEQHKDEPHQVVRAKLADDQNNILRWAVRLLTPNQVPHEAVPIERLKAAWTLNPDYDILAKKKIPMIVLFMNQDLFFPNREIRERIKQLRSFPEARVGLVITDANHEFPHYNASGVGLMLNLVSDKFMKHWNS